MSAIDRRVMLRTVLTGAAATAAVAAGMSLMPLVGEAAPTTISGLGSLKTEDHIEKAVVVVRRRPRRRRVCWWRRGRRICRWRWI
jgi:hypothetical protein